MAEFVSLHYLPAILRDSQEQGRRGGAAIQDLFRGGKETFQNYNTLGSDLAVCKKNRSNFLRRVINPVKKYLRLSGRAYGTISFYNQVFLFVNSHISFPANQQFPGNFPVSTP